MPKVSFNYLDKKLPITCKSLLKEHIKYLFTVENKTLHSLDYIFCSDEALLQMNQSFLKHDTYTDIITFNLSDKFSNGIIGEIYISVDRIKENAILHCVDFLDEVVRITCHGALHLCGYNDKQKRDKVKMTEKEDYYLSEFKKKLY